MTENQLSERQVQLLDELFSSMPNDFEERHQQAFSIRQAFHMALGKAIQDSLNAYLAECPVDTLDERRDVATTVNRLLRELNLGIRCPKTNQPAILSADYANERNPDIYRFRLSVPKGNGRYAKTLTSRELPLPLELIPTHPRRESFARGYIPRRSDKVDLSQNDGRKR